MQVLLLCTQQEESKGRDLEEEKPEEFARRLHGTCGVSSELKVEQSMMDIMRYTS